ncbi:unnamed protein product [Didymodactylos carnosus]|uniref:HMG box domain-containing protein n=1 Tax=Didymodactylos carnosus TaxID=1234261 RepID=A0A813XA97_9BILA|nr:unnamed protein product [Didymodactylos carnosus]CAF0873010.1 unnamed protein product [Didymodactylos carnosus]CAF3536189.1 unnamed protein product [Didymodactylos carnosus]CAF3660203.1 unnamed protein product [Didymodactylos carnosus]
MLTRNACISSCSSHSNSKQQQQQSQSTLKNSIQITRNTTRKQANEIVENNNLNVDGDEEDYFSTERNKRLKGGGNGSLKRSSIDDNNNHHHEISTNNNRKYNNSCSQLDNISSAQHCSSQHIGLLAHSQRTQSFITTSMTSSQPLKKRWLANHENSVGEFKQSQPTQNGHMITVNNQLPSISCAMSQPSYSELETILFNLKANIDKCNFNDWINQSVLVKKPNSDQIFTYVPGNIYGTNESIITIKTKTPCSQELIQIDLLNVQELFDIILDNLPVYTDLDIGKRVLCKLSTDHTQYYMGIITDKTQQQQFRIKLVDYNNEQIVLLSRQSLRLVLPPWHEEIEIDWNLALELILTRKLSRPVSSSIETKSTTIEDNSRTNNEDLTKTNSNALLPLASTMVYLSSPSGEQPKSSSENSAASIINDSNRTATASRNTTEEDQDELSNGDSGTINLLGSNQQDATDLSTAAALLNNKNFKKGDIIESSNRIRKKFNGKQWRRLCSRDNCPRESQRRGLCSRHLSQKGKGLGGTSSIHLQQALPPPQLLIPHYQHQYHHSVSSSPVSTSQSVRGVYDYFSAMTPRQQHHDQASFNLLNSYPNQQTQVQQLLTTSMSPSLVSPAAAYNLHRGSYSAPHSRTTTPMPPPTTVTLTPLSSSTLFTRVNSNSSTSCLSTNEQQKQQQPRLLFMNDRSPPVQQHSTSLIRDKQLPTSYDDNDEGRRDKDLSGAVNISDNGIGNIVSWTDILPKISIRVDTTKSKIQRQIPVIDPDGEDDDDVFPERSNSSHSNPQQQQSSSSSQQQSTEREQSQNNYNNQGLSTETKLRLTPSPLQQDISRSLRPRNLSSNTNNIHDKSHIRRPMNSFMLFSKEQRPLIHSEQPNRDNRTVSKILGEKWYALTKKDRDKYDLLAKSLRQEHSKQNPNYKWSSGTRKQQPKEQKTSVEQQIEHENEEEENGDMNACENGDEKEAITDAHMRFRIQDKDEEQTHISPSICCSTVPSSQRQQYQLASVLPSFSNISQQNIESPVNDETKSDQNELLTKTAALICRRSARLQCLNNTELQKLTTTANSEISGFESLQNLASICSEIAEREREQQEQEQQRSSLSPVNKNIESDSSSQFSPINKVNVSEIQLPPILQPIPQTACQQNNTTKTNLITTGTKNLINDLHLVDDRFRSPLQFKGTAFRLHQTSSESRVTHSHPSSPSFNQCVPSYGAQLSSSSNQHFSFPSPAIPPPKFQNSHSYSFEHSHSPPTSSTPAIGKRSNPTTSSLPTTRQTSPNGSIDDGNGNEKINDEDVLNLLLEQCRKNKLLEEKLKQLQTGNNGTSTATTSQSPGIESNSVTSTTTKETLILSGQCVSLSVTASGAKQSNSKIFISPFKPTVPLKKQSLADYRRTDDSQQHIQQTQNYNNRSIHVAKKFKEEQQCQQPVFNFCPNALHNRPCQSLYPSVASTTGSNHSSTSSGRSTGYSSGSSSSSSSCSLEATSSYSSRSNSSLSERERKTPPPESIKHPHHKQLQIIHEEQLQQPILAATVLQDGNDDEVSNYLHNLCSNSGDDRCKGGMSISEMLKKQYNSWLSTITDPSVHKLLEEQIKSGAKDFCQQILMRKQCSTSQSPIPTTSNDNLSQMYEQRFYQMSEKNSHECNSSWMLSPSLSSTIQSTDEIHGNLLQPSSQQLLTNSKSTPIETRSSSLRRMKSNKDQQQIIKTHPETAIEDTKTNSHSIKRRKIEITTSVQRPTTRSRSISERMSTEVMVGNNNLTKLKTSNVLTHNEPLSSDHAHFTTDTINLRQRKRKASIMDTPVPLATGTGIVQEQQPPSPTYSQTIITRSTSDYTKQLDEMKNQLINASSLRSVPSTVASSFVSSSTVNSRNQLLARLKVIELLKSHIYPTDAEITAFQLQNSELFPKKRDLNLRIREIRQKVMTAANATKDKEGQ